MRPNRIGVPLQESIKHLSALDGLRAVSVVAVIINHLDHTILPNGYLGVDVFFVISGFVITLSLLGKPAVSTRDAIIDFYVRRFKRLAPALAFAVIVGACLIRLFDPDPTRSTITGILSLFGISNLFLYYQAIDYFGPNVQLNPFSHTWSLGVEEQFYIFFPALLLLGRRHARLGLRTRLWLTAGLSVASLIGFAAIYGVAQPAAYFLLPFRFWEMGFGCVLAMMCTSNQMGKRHASERNWSAIPLLLLAVIFVLPSTFPVVVTIAAVAVSGGLILCIWHGAPQHGFLTNRIVLYVGMLSYSLYLWHWIVICLSRWTVGVSWYVLPLQIAVMLALAAASYHLVETPLRTRVWFAHKLANLAAGAAILVVSAAVIFVGKSFDLPSFSGSRTSDEIAGIGVEPGYRTKYSHRAVDDCVLSQIFSMPEELAHNVARCRATIPDRTDLTFIGDSHALDLFPLSDLVYESGRASVVNLYQTSCQIPPVSGAPGECSLGQKYLNGLPDSESGREVIVIRNNISPKGADGNFGKYTAALDAFVTRLIGRGYKVVYVAPAPKYYSLALGGLCSPQWFRPTWALSPRCSTGYAEPREEQLARRQDFFDHLIKLGKTQPDFLVFDPFEALCGTDTGRCSPVRDGKLMYRDESHLTEYGSERLNEPFWRFLQNNGLAR